MIAVLKTLPLPITCVSSKCPIPTSAKISTFLQIPLNPTALDSFLSATAHMIPERIKQAVTAAKEITKPAAYRRKDCLNHIPKLFHRKSLHFVTN